MKVIGLIAALIFAPILLASDDYCPEVRFEGDKIDFSDTEVRLFCGDPKSHAWKNIPAYQAQIVIQGFLQSRGYLTPEFSRDGETLIVKTGKVHEIESIAVKVENKKLRRKIRRDVRRLYKGRVLDTSMLNSVEGEAMARLRSRGYPCGKVNSHADVTTDTVTLLLEPKDRHVFGEIDREKIKGLHDNALLRFYPMKPEERFDSELLELTEKRLLRSQVVQGTYFLENCSDEGKTFSLSQRFIEGPPRTLRFGAGASTEAGPMARARWSHNRWGPMASQLSATVEASFRVQSLNLSADYFAWEDSPRRSIFTDVEVTRESQFDYEQVLNRVRPRMKWTRDIGDYQNVWMAGPAYEVGTFLSDLKGETRSFNNVALHGSFERTGHDYEFFDVHPEGGHQQSVSLSYRTPRLGFSETLTRVDTSFVSLGQLGTFRRGRVIGGVRLKAGVAFTGGTTKLEDLPPEVKFFGGGSDDLRGYLLRTLPRNDGAGALTRYLVKLELRNTNFFHEKVEAFTFWDLGQFGDRSATVDQRIWHSPGFGIRWLSPIGMVQGYWARSLSYRPYEDNGNFFYGGLGGTF